MKILKVGTEVGQYSWRSSNYVVPPPPAAAEKVISIRKAVASLQAESELTDPKVVRYYDSSLNNPALLKLIYEWDAIRNRIQDLYGPFGTSFGYISEGEVIRIETIVLEINSELSDWKARWAKTPKPEFSSLPIPAPPTKITAGGVLGGVGILTLGALIVGSIATHRKPK